MKPQPVLRCVLVSTAVATLAVGCSSSKAASPGGSQPTVAGSAAPATSDLITIKDYSYNDLTVKPGATVTVTNADAAAHTVTSTDKTTFDSGSLGKDKSATFTAPSKVGKYSFYCTFHNYMKGTLTVAS